LGRKANPKSRSIMKRRIYTDTSVIGGCLDVEFEEGSLGEKGTDIFYSPPVLREKPRRSGGFRL
jgi:hypothetical protein